MSLAFGSAHLVTLDINTSAFILASFALGCINIKIPNLRAIASIPLGAAVGGGFLTLSGLRVYIMILYMIPREIVQITQRPMKPPKFMANTSCNASQFLWNSEVACWREGLGLAF